MIILLLSLLSLLVVLGVLVLGVGLGLLRLVVPAVLFPRSSSNFSIRLMSSPKLLLLYLLEVEVLSILVPVVMLTHGRNWRGKGELEGGQNVTSLLVLLLGEGTFFL